ncbi:MAG: prephenate dehydrogenase/arogenate dehydrogenase family protein [Phycisphaerae bacterium]|jgi:prephenate dehydrogenase
MNDLKQITVIGLGLLGGSVALTGQRFAGPVKIVGFSHRAATRKKAKEILLGTQIADNLADSVVGSDIVILATPIRTFEDILAQIGSSLKAGAIVTDVGSTKVQPHKWAKKTLPKNVHYVGSHPIAGSEQRGVEFARDDLFEQADCIVTVTKNTNKKAVSILKDFWLRMGCRVKFMTPAEHDKVFANVSHLAHIAAAALLNANNTDQLQYSGKGFLDTCRVAGGPPNIWVDILSTNSANCAKGIDKLKKELDEFKTAILKGDNNKLQKLLERARDRRADLIKNKLQKRELV